MLDFIGDSPVVAHNGFDFDFPFINYELTQLGLQTIPSNRQQDTIVIARHKIFGPKDHKLDTLAKWFGISLTARADAHGALIDAEILAKVYLELESVAPVQNMNDIMVEQLAAMQKHPKIGADFPKRSFPPHADELTAHEEFMKGILK